MSRLPLTDIIHYAIIGIAGALVRELVVHRNTVFFPRRWEAIAADGKLKKGWDTGILGAFVVGAIVSILVDGSPRTAFVRQVCARSVLPPSGFLPHEVLRLWVHRTSSRKLLSVIGCPTAINAS